jgi:hypothetical protein
VARNALSMIAREEPALIAEVHDRALAEALLAGREGLATPGLLARLKRLALAKLAADVPKYPALEAARQRWTGEE